MCCLKLDRKLKLKVKVQSTKWQEKKTKGRERDASTSSIQHLFTRPDIPKIIRV